MIKQSNVSPKFLNADTWSLPILLDIVTSSLRRSIEKSWILVQAGKGRQGNDNEVNKALRSQGSKRINKRDYRSIDTDLFSGD